MPSLEDGIKVNVVTICIAKAKHVLLLSSERKGILPSNSNFHVYVVKKKSLCVKFNCSLKEPELSGEADRNSFSVRQNKAAIIFLTCKP